MDKVYKAKYPPTFFITISGGIFVGFILIFFYVLSDGFPFLVMSFISFAGIFFLLSILISEIRFDDDSLNVVYLFFRKKEFLYSEIVDFGSTIIVTRSGKINLYGLNNSDELFRILNNLINRGRIKKDQIKYEISFWERISGRAYLPALLISVITWPIILSIFQFENYWLIRGGFLLIFFPLYIAFAIHYRNNE